MEIILIIKLTCKPFSWALCSISRTAETSSSEHPSSWRCNISSNAISTCSKTSPNLECKLFGHSVVRIQWNSVTIHPTQATIVWTHQCWGDVWITREVYAYITTDITSSWGLIATKKYWNTRRVYLEHKCIWTKVRMMLDKGLKNKKHTDYSPAHAWNVEFALFLFPKVCLKIQQSESLASTSIVFPYARTNRGEYQLGEVIKKSVNGQSYKFRAFNRWL